MSLCCCSTAAGRGFFLSRRPLLNLRTTATVSRVAAAATATSSLSAPQQRQVAVYVEALLDWNQFHTLESTQRMNLTAVTDEAEVMTRHVEDSLAVLPPLERAYRSRSVTGGGDIDGISLIDVGSGAGLPGLILAVARPRQNVGQSLDYREAYDITAARAVAELKVLAEYCLPLVRIGGLFIAAKGHDPHEEVKNAKGAVQKLGASMLEMCNVMLLLCLAHSDFQVVINIEFMVACSSLCFFSVESMGPHGQRTAVIYLKERATPRKYPRLPGISHVPSRKVSGVLNFLIPEAETNPGTPSKMPL
ncbi:hypothetical protein HU200_005477 [Digitaria exilis]|uniref:Ribosomal RNA small subunit methyltransferase G n=1 Tax=Digitaria exilis TaxID=1010633 RepID=A0A835KSH1_9POAL|nr:hypothetical protein HU200_005477 [Digitaria exilis]